MKTKRRGDLEESTYRTETRTKSSQSRSFIGVALRKEADEYGVKERLGRTNIDNRSIREG